jgi:hypothetical protein
MRKLNENIAQAKGIKNWEDKQSRKGDIYFLMNTKHGSINTFV